MLMPSIRKRISEVCEDNVDAKHKKEDIRGL